MTEPGNVERGAAEEGAGVPVTPTEEAASRRPPSDPDQEKGSGLDGGGRYGDGD